MSTFDAKRTAITNAQVIVNTPVENCPYRCGTLAGDAHARLWLWLWVYSSYIKSGERELGEE